MNATILATLMFAFGFGAQQQAPPPTQQTGHVLSAETHRSSHSTSIYNPQTGGYSQGTGHSVERDTEIQVANLVYESPQIHKEIQVGKDYPVVIETDKHGAPKKLTLTAGAKTYSYRITGTREVKAN